MGWLISRQEATSNPELARRKILSLFENMEELAEPERLLMTILVDAVLIVEAYRGARHQVALLPDLQRSVDALLRELDIIQRTKEWAREPLIDDGELADSPA